MKPFLGAINHWELLINLSLHYMNILEELHKIFNPGLFCTVKMTMK